MLRYPSPDVRSLFMLFFVYFVLLHLLISININIRLVFKGMISSMSENNWVPQDSHSDYTKVPDVTLAEISGTHTFTSEMGIWSSYGVWASFEDENIVQCLIFFEIGLILFLNGKNLQVQVGFLGRWLSWLLPFFVHRSSSIYSGAFFTFCIRVFFLLNICW